MSIVDYLKFKSSRPLIHIAKDMGKLGNFKHHYRSPDGLIMWGHNKSDKYSHVLTGENCQQYRSDGITDFALMDALLSDGAEFTRLDIAVNTDIISVDDFWVWSSCGVGALADQNVVKMIKSKEHGGETVYIGDRKQRAKKGVFRCYNYSLAHGLDDFVTRFELECGRNTAHSAAKHIARGDEHKSVMCKYINFPSAAKWEVLMSADELEAFTRGKSSKQQEDEQMVKRIEWLIDQVAPSLGRTMAREVMKFGSYPTYYEFMRAARQAFDNEISEIMKEQTD